MIDTKGTVFRNFKRRFTRMSVVFLLITILFLIGLLVSILIPSLSPVNIALNAGHSITVGDIYDGVALELEFVCPEDSLSGMSFLVATYEQSIIGGALLVSLVDSNDRLVFVKRIDSIDIKDNSTLEFSFPVQIASKGITYRARFETENIFSDTPLTFWANEHIVDNVKTKLDGEEIYGTMLISIFCITETYPLTFDLVILASISFILFSIAIGKAGLDLPSEENDIDHWRSKDA